MEALTAANYLLQRLSPCSMSNCPRNCSGLHQWASPIACDICEPSSPVDGSTGSTEVMYHPSWAGLVLERVVMEIVWSK